ncbi:hypothetical protein ABZ208_23805 [Streptomyces sp. NPDC006208]|uniref:hypothetical protein n=1 Tax=Streptomyces sp. NPDC006208 TaxID=3156734 RepID=UPI00339DFF83
MGTPVVLTRTVVSWGALWRADEYLALTVPAIGSRLSVSRLRLTSRHVWQPLVLRSTLRVGGVVGEA